MDFELISATRPYKKVIKNLMQFYIYDFSVYVDCDVEESGLYKDFLNLDDYWKEKDKKFPYLIQKDEKYIGFVLIKSLKSNEDCLSIAEFFVMKRYRRMGIGKAVANQLFVTHKGQWEVHQRIDNQPAQEFWNKVIAEYTNGEFTDHIENERRVQNFKS